MDEAASQVDKSVGDDAPRDPEAIRQEIEQTRREVGDTAAELAHKADVKAQAKSKVEEAKSKVEEIKERVSEAAPDSAGQAASAVQAKVRENPTPAMVAGAAFGGFVLGILLGRR
jgi:ElaB/YqjD/DUF883 family membrane-anchored ribosome-binding protein